MLAGAQWLPHFIYPLCYRGYHGNWRVPIEVALALSLWLYGYLRAVLLSIRSAIKQLEAGGRCRLQNYFQTSSRENLCVCVCSLCVEKYWRENVPESKFTFPAQVYVFIPTHQQWNDNRHTLRWQALGFFWINSEMAKNKSNNIFSSGPQSCAATCVLIRHNMLTTAN